MSDKAVSINNISFSYEKKPIYKEFSLDISANELFFIMGVNGCGKTTLLKILCSFLSVDSGDVYIHGKRINEYDAKSLSKVVSYVPQILNLSSDFIVKDYLALGRTPYKRIFDSLDNDDYSIVEKYAVELGVDNLLDIEFNTLSGGQKQNVAIARALIQETPIIILDEPMSALDLGKQADFLSLLLRLKEDGKTVILTSHNPTHAMALGDVCKVCLIEQGTILGLGNCTDVLTQNNVSRIYGDKVSISMSGSAVEFHL